MSKRNNRNNRFKDWRERDRAKEQHEAGMDDRKPWLEGEVFNANGKVAIAIPAQGIKNAIRFRIESPMPATKHFPAWADMAVEEIPCRINPDICQPPYLRLADCIATVKQGFDFTCSAGSAVMREMGGTKFVFFPARLQGGVQVIMVDTTDRIEMWGGRLGSPVTIPAPGGLKPGDIVPMEMHVQAEIVSRDWVEYFNPALANMPPGAMFITDDPMATFAISIERSLADAVLLATKDRNPQPDEMEVLKGLAAYHLVSPYKQKLAEIHNDYKQIEVMLPEMRRRIYLFVDVDAGRRYVCDTPLVPYVEDN